jgi:hypothetical protein
MSDTALPKKRGRKPIIENIEERRKHLFKIIAEGNRKRNVEKKKEIIKNMLDELKKKMETLEIDDVTNSMSNIELSDNLCGKTHKYSNELVNYIYENYKVIIKK